MNPTWSDRNESAIADLPANLSALSAGLRRVVPVTDQWEVRTVDLSEDESNPWIMIELRFSRRVGERKYSFLDAISPGTLAYSGMSCEWIGEYEGRKWLSKIEDAIASDLLV